MRLSHRVLLLWLAYWATKEHQRRYQKIPHSVLIQLALSPWQKVYASCNDQAYITMMCFDIESFEKILEKFSPMYSTHTPLMNQG
jgi:hypothetical protein